MSFNNTINTKKFNDICVQDFDAVVVGCGFAGAVVARQLAEKGNKKVLIIEKRGHIAGNMYDKYNAQGILIHKYGPHIFHTNSKAASNYLKRFCQPRPYEHRVQADIFGTYMPVPFNKTSMKIAFGEERAKELTAKLIETFGDECKVTINELRAENDPDLAEVADYVYENVFLHYTEKQWGVTPEEVDPSVTARVPIFISEDDRYFQDKYQFMPLEGYTRLFKKMLTHDNIIIAPNTEAESVFGLEFAGKAESDPLTGITIQFQRYDKPIIYTGPLDELFLWRFGRLPYRSLNFEFETLNMKQKFPCGTVNYTVSEDYTRITEYKHLTGQKHEKTTIMREYSLPYEDVKNQVPYYAIINEKNEAHYNRYKKLTESMPNLHLIGRLAEYKYYNMDQIIDRALELSEKLLAD